MLDEEWRPIPGWEDLYEASNIGRIRSLDRMLPGRWGSPRRLRGRVRKTRKCAKSDHHTLSLKRDGIEKRCYVHTLVLLAFHGPRPKDRPVARHLNGDATDNRAVNLAWGTHSENNLDQVRHGTHFEARRTHCKHGHPFSGDNLHIGSKGQRCCRACTSAAQRRYQARKKAS